MSWQCPPIPSLTRVQVELFRSISRTQSCALRQQPFFIVSNFKKKRPRPFYAVNRSSWSGFTIVRLVPLIVIHWSRRNWFSSRVTVSREVPAMLAISS
jgi:hypothetical protein